MGLGTQVVALGDARASCPTSWLVVPYVMVAQALSGIAKDLTKMSSKSAVKLVVPEDAPGALFKWVAILTGSKNALKGVGFFLGGLLLTVVGFQTALLILAALVAHRAGRRSLALMRGGLGTAEQARPSSRRCSPTTARSTCSPPRASSCSPRATSGSSSACPSSCARELGWSFWQVGGFLAVWVIGYGIVQASAPRFIRGARRAAAIRTAATATWLAFVLAAFPAGIALALGAGVDPTVVVVGGLIAFGVVFALNSAVHSYLILAYADGDKVAMNVGFYYMANAGGRLAGTVLSGAALPVAGPRGVPLGVGPLRPGAPASCRACCHRPSPARPSGAREARGTGAASHHGVLTSIALGQRCGLPEGSVGDSADLPGASCLRAVLLSIVDVMAVLRT